MMRAVIALMLLTSVSACTEYVEARAKYDQARNQYYASMGMEPPMRCVQDIVIESRFRCYK